MALICFASCTGMSASRAAKVKGNSLEHINHHISLHESERLVCLFGSSSEVVHLKRFQELCCISCASQLLSRTEGKATARIANLVNAHYYVSEDCISDFHVGQSNENGCLALSQNVVTSHYAFWLSS